MSVTVQQCNVVRSTGGGWKGSTEFEYLSLQSETSKMIITVQQREITKQQIIIMIIIIYLNDQLYNIILTEGSLNSQR